MQQPPPPPGGDPLAWLATSMWTSSEAGRQQQQQQQQPPQQVPAPAALGFAFQTYDPQQFANMNATEFLLPPAAYVPAAAAPPPPLWFAGAQLHAALDPPNLAGGGVGVPYYDPLVLPPGMQARFAASVPARAFRPQAQSVAPPPSPHRASVAAREELADTADVDGRKLATTKQGHPLYALVDYFTERPAGSLFEGQTAKNVPHEVTEEEARYLIKLYRFKYDFDNGGDFSRALIRIGFFNGATEFDSDERLGSDAKIDSYIGGRLSNVMRLAALMRVDVFVKDLRLPENIETLRALLRPPLAHFLRVTARQSKALDYVRKSLESGVSLSSFEDVDAPERDLFFFRDNQECMFLSLYNQPKVISAGSYGFVLAYRDTRTGSLHAVKFQRIDTLAGASEPGYIELRIMSAIQKLTRHWNDARKAGPFNYVRLDEWARCRLDSRAVFKPLLPEMTETARRHISNKQEVFQIIVQQLAGEGDLGKAMGASEASLRRFFDDKTFAAIVAQVFGHIHALSVAARYSHNDLKPENCLLERQSAFSPYRYLVYNPHAGSPTLYVPIEDTFNHVLKLADQGLATMKLGEDDASVVPRVHSLEWRYNPARDLESFALTVTALLLSHPALTRFDAANRRVDNAAILTSAVSPLVYHFLRRCIGVSAPGASSDAAANRAARKDYAEVRKMLLDLAEHTDKLWPYEDRRNSAERAALRLYRSHRFIWVRAASQADLICIRDMLVSEPLLENIRKRPPNLDRSNSIVMNDYIK